MKITIIGGGNMGGAIAGGLAAGNMIAAGDITVTARTARTLDRIKECNSAIVTMSDNRAAVEDADLVLFAVKPWLLEIAAGVRDVLDYRRQQVASVVAGVSFERLTEMLDNGSGIAPVLYRIIPNTAISLGRSVTFIAHSGATGEQLNAVVAMFDQLGRTFVVTEEMMTAGTSLASCGIAFALKYIDASIRGGVELGFSEAESREVMQTMWALWRCSSATVRCPSRRSTR
ncbi:MAG: pyrroline-5-carboxylate reductase family protein [Alistipes sp.]